MRFLIILLSLIVGVFQASASTKLDEIAALRERADSLHGVGRTDSAVIVGDQAVRLAVESGNPTQIIGTNAAQGVYLRS